MYNLNGFIQHLKTVAANNKSCHSLIETTITRLNNITATHQDPNSIYAALKDGISILEKELPRIQSTSSNISFTQIRETERLLITLIFYLNTHHKLCKNHLSIFPKDEEIDQVKRSLEYLIKNIISDCCPLTVQEKIFKQLIASQNSFDLSILIDNYCDVDGFEQWSVHAGKAQLRYLANRTNSMIYGQTINRACKTINRIVQRIAKKSGEDPITTRIENTIATCRTNCFKKARSYFSNQFSIKADSYLFLFKQDKEKARTLARSLRSINEWGTAIKKIHDLYTELNFFNIGMKRLCRKSIVEIVNLYIFSKDYPQMLIAFKTLPDTYYFKTMKHQLFKSLRNHFRHLNNDQKIEFIHTLLNLEYQRKEPLPILKKLIVNAAMGNKDNPGIPLSRKFTINRRPVTLEEIITKHNRFIQRLTKSLSNFFFGIRGKTSRCKVNFSPTTSHQIQTVCNLESLQPDAEKISEATTQFQNGLEEKIDEYLEKIPEEKRNTLEAPTNLAEKVEMLRQQMETILSTLQQGRQHQKIIRHIVQASPETERIQTKERHILANSKTKKIYGLLCARLESRLLCARAVASGWVNPENKQTTMAGTFIGLAGEAVNIPIISSLVKGFAQALTFGGRTYRQMQCEQLTRLTLTNSEAGLFAKLLTLQILEECYDSIDKLSDISIDTFIQQLLHKILLILSKVMAEDDKYLAMEKLVEKYVLAIRTPREDTLLNQLRLKSLTLVNITDEKSVTTVDEVLSAGLESRTSFCAPYSVFTNRQPTPSIQSIQKTFGIVFKEIDKLREQILAQKHESGFRDMQLFALRQQTETSDHNSSPVLLRIQSPELNERSNTNNNKENKRSKGKEKVTPPQETKKQPRYIHVLKELLEKENKFNRDILSLCSYFQSKIKELPENTETEKKKRLNSLRV